MLECLNISKNFGQLQAVRNISFRMGRGEILGFLGLNGAGKTTTMRLIAGVLGRDSGHVMVNGHSLDQSHLAAKRKIGYLPEGAPLYGEMTVLAFLRFIARVREVENVAAATERVIHECDLHSVLAQSIETLSKGFKRRVGLAAALIADPPILILDEPTDSLDPLQKNHIRTLLQRISADKAILISTHILEEVPAVCNRVIVIHQGQLRADEHNSDFWRHKNLEINFTRIVSDVAA